MTLNLQAYSPIYFRLAATNTVSPTFILAGADGKHCTVNRSFRLKPAILGQPVNLSEVLYDPECGRREVLVTALYFTDNHAIPAQQLPGCNICTAASSGPARRITHRRSPFLPSHSPWRPLHHDAARPGSRSITCSSVVVFAMRTRAAIGQQHLTWRMQPS